MAAVSAIDLTAAPWYSLLTPSRKALAQRLVSDNQSHVFSAWDTGVVAERDVDRFFAQVFEMVSNFCSFLPDSVCATGLQAELLDEAYPGGLVAYTAKARQLLAASAAGENPFEGCTASVRPIRHQLIDRSDIHPELRTVLICRYRKA